MLASLPRLCAPTLGLTSFFSIIDSAPLLSQPAFGHDEPMALGAAHAGRPEISEKEGAQERNLRAGRARVRFVAP